MARRFVSRGCTAGTGATRPHFVGDCARSRFFSHALEEPREGALVMMSADALRAGAKHVQRRDGAWVPADLAPGALQWSFAAIV